ncbi:MAG: phage holin family protein [Actinomycetota bacterium]
MPVVGAAQVVVLFGLDAIMDSVELTGLGRAVAVVVVIALANALLWPIAVRLTLPLLALTLGLFTFVLNAGVVLLAGNVVSEFEVATFGAAVLVSIAFALTSSMVGSVLRLDDDDVWRRAMIRRSIRERHRFDESDEPGILLLQIDGLSHAVLLEAVEDGHAPYLASLLRTGRHRVHPWECDLSSQTGAMQAGILFGNNEDMPAFRWHEKESGEILVSNNPRHAAEIERRQSDGAGLLADDGASRGNVFSGDAPDALYTFSALRAGSDVGRSRLLSLFASPSWIVRILGLFVADIVREQRSARAARRADVRPRGHRGGTYPLLRASVTVGLTEITTATLAGDIYRGVPIAYADFVGYDEVAHHSGIRRPESLDTLRRTDDHIRRLMLGVPDAPRPYELIVLSDHGQTQGATFLQRHGLTLEELVHQLAGSARVVAPPLVTEAWGNVNALMTDVVNDEHSVASRVVRRALRKRIRGDGEVELGPSSHPQPVAGPEVGDEEIVILASGNLGLVTFSHLEGRATLEQIEVRHPGLIAGLADHDGVGFVMVRSASGDSLVLGAQGVHHLADGTVEGVDPLLPYGENAARHLRRTSGFRNCPDLIVNGRFDVETDEGAAFEELIGFHGGLGGLQARPFVMVPSRTSSPTQPIVGAEELHRQLRAWIGELRLADPAP